MKQRLSRSLQAQGLLATELSRFTAEGPPYPRVAGAVNARHRILDDLAWCFARMAAVARFIRSALPGAFRRSGRKARQEIPAAPIDRGGHGCHLIKEAGICTPPDALGPPMDRARFATALPFGERAAWWARSFDLAQGRSEL